MPHGLDSEHEVFFYEQEFYVLSNFSAFQVNWRGIDFQTAEHAYQWSRFGHSYDHSLVQNRIMNAKSAHEAFKLAQDWKRLQVADWDDSKLAVMKRILQAKAGQHEYVRRKLLETGDRRLIENSWRDDFWGWGPDHNGQNWLGRLWMEVRSEIRDGVYNLTHYSCNIYNVECKSP